MEEEYRSNSLYCAPLLYPKQIRNKGLQHKIMTEYRSQKVKRKNSNLYRIPIATKGVLNAYNNWLSTLPKPKKRTCPKSQSTSSSDKCYKKFSSKANSRQILHDYIEKNKTASKANIDVKPFTRKLWENVVENAFNYVNALKFISESLYPPNNCQPSDQELFLINFDWGSYLLYLLCLITSAEAILRLLDNGEIVSHCQGYITGIVGLDKSDWYKLFSEIELVIEKARYIKELVVKSHGIPFDCILKSFPSTPKNLNWDLFITESDCLNLSAKIVLDFLYSIFFVDDSCINGDIDVRKAGSGICEEISKRGDNCNSFESGINMEAWGEETDLSSEDKPSTSTQYKMNYPPTKSNASKKEHYVKEKKQKSYKNSTNKQNIPTVRPIFLNELQENPSQARVAWIRSKYNIIDLKKRSHAQGHNLEMAQNSLEYLTKLKLLPEESKNFIHNMLTSNSTFNAEVEGKRIRRFTPHMNVQNVRQKMPKANCSYTERGFSAVMPFHRYVSYFILNLDEPKRPKNQQLSQTPPAPRIGKTVDYKTKQSIQSTDSHGNTVHHPMVRKMSKKTNIKPISEYHEESYEIESIIPEKSKIFENPVPERRSRPRNDLKKRQSSTMLKGSTSTKSEIFTQKNNARPSIPFSSLPRDHPLITTHSLKKEPDPVSDIPVKKSTPSHDLKHTKKSKSRDRLVNYCMVDLEEKIVKESNLIEHLHESDKKYKIKQTIISHKILDNIEHFLNSGLRQNKLIRLMEEIHLPLCHCQKFSGTADPLIMILIDQYDGIENHTRLKDYNILMLKMFTFLYPTAFVTKESEIPNFPMDFEGDLKSHFVSVSDEDASFSDKKVFSAILDMTEKRFMDEHRSAQKLASKLPSLV